MLFECWEEKARPFFRTMRLSGISQQVTSLTYLSVPTQIYLLCTILSVLLKKRRITNNNMGISQLFKQLNSIQYLQARQSRKLASMIVHFDAVNVWQTKPTRISPVLRRNSYFGIPDSASICRTSKI